MRVVSWNMVCLSFRVRRKLKIEMCLRDKVGGSMTGNSELPVISQRFLPVKYTISRRAIEIKKLNLKQYLLSQQQKPQPPFPKFRPRLPWRVRLCEPSTWQTNHNRKIWGLGEARRCCYRAGELDRRADWAVRASLRSARARWGGVRGPAAGGQTPPRGYCGRGDLEPVCGQAAGFARGSGVALSASACMRRAGADRPAALRPSPDR